MDSSLQRTSSGNDVELQKPKSRLLMFRDRLLSPHLKEYRPHAAESLHQRQIESTAAAAVVVGGPTPVHGTPEGSSCCQVALRSSPSTLTGAQDLPPSSSVAAALPPAVECCQRAQSAGSKSRNASSVVQQSGDRPQSSSSPSTGNKRAAMKSSLPLTKCYDGRRPGSARSSARTHQRFAGTAVEGPPRRTAVVGGITVADDVAAVSSSSDAYSDDTSSANDHNSTSPPPGLLSRIVVRKMGRRTGTAEAKQTLPVAVSVCDGEAGNNTDHGDVSAVAAEADAAREQFPFIFNLLRGHAINSQAVGPGPRLAGQLSADSRRSKTSAHHQHHQQLQQQAGKPAVTTCRQHQATPTGKDGKTSSRPESVRPQRRLLPASSADVIRHSPTSAGSPTSPSSAGQQASTTASTTCSAVTSAPFVSRAALMASKRAQQCTVAADVHVSPDADSGVTDDVTSAGSCHPSGRYCSATVGSFRRRDRLRSSLPVVSAMNRSLERPLGVVFLVFRNETRPGLLPNEVTSISTVWALFVRAFPDALSMQWFESSKWTIYFLDQINGVYRVLQDLRTISDRGILRLEECETCLSSSGVADTCADIAGKLSCSLRGLQSPQSARRTVCDAAVSTNSKERPPDEALPSPPLFRLHAQQRHPASTAKESSTVKSDSRSSPSDRLSAMETRVDSLAALVQCAIMRPTDSVDSLASDSSQATAVHKSPLSDRKLMSAGDDVTSRLGDIWRQARELKSEAQLLRQAHVEHVTWTKQLLQATFIKLKAAMLSVVKQSSGANKTVRQHIVEEQGGYCLDAARVEEQLRNLEACVEELRTDVVSGKSQVLLTDVEAMVLALGHIGRSLASLRGRLQHLQDRMKPVMASEVEVVVQEERFIKEEPHRLDKSVVRCKQLSGTLSTLKKLAMVQGGVSTTTSNSEEPTSKLKLRSPTTARNHVTREHQLQQACQRLSPEDRTAAAGDTVETSTRPRSHSRRSSYSGTSTGSDALSSNGGLSDDAAVFDEDASQPRVMSVAMKDQRPSTESAPPAPPPRRFAVPPPRSSDVWQRHAVRPATDGVRRRILAAADSGPPSTPKSCPTSPLLDNVGVRRGDQPQDGVLSGRRTHPPPSRTDGDRETAAAVEGSTSTPVTRRTRLPLSPLARTHRDVR